MAMTVLNSSYPMLCSATTSGCLLDANGRTQNDKAVPWNQSFTARKWQYFRRRKGLFQVPLPFQKTLVRGMNDGHATEEDRWLREEKRWLREEGRWLREEERWNKERNFLIEQSTALKEEIEVLKAEIIKLKNQLRDEKTEDREISDLIVSLTSLLQTLNTTSVLETNSAAKATPQIPNTTSSAIDIKERLGQIALEAPKVDVELDTPAKQISTNKAGNGSTLAAATPAEISFTQELKAVNGSTSAPASAEVVKRTLKKGAEGEDVKAMQEALSSLGFYSGEDDMEYSIFSSGTERAVRTWQATLGISEDGIVTTDLLTRLLEKKSTSSPHSNETSMSSAKGPSASVTEGKAKVSDVPLTKTEPSASPYTPPSPGRVYLLGENRWEEPDRLNVKSGSATTVQGERCYSCKGQGNIMCTECEGTGELNVEEQFLEWAEEGAKCPYCEGQGMINCDTCDGKGVRVL